MVAGLLLTHGAGGDRNHRLFLAIEAALDLPVHRIDFAYRAKGPRQPPTRTDKLVPELVQEVNSWAAELGVASSELVIGGRSLGGRVCSMAVADGLAVAGLVLLSYPLHPPGRPDRLRVEHLAKIKVPCLFISGDRDPFGTPEEFADHLEAIPARHELVILPGDAHDPRKHDDVIVGAVERFVRALSDERLRG